MPKINQEEYEVLKELDDEWKWIARDEDKSLWVFTEKPVRKSDPSPYWDTETEGPYTALELIDEIHLFQFIQWEDEEPYNIAELIEEYEFEQELLTRRESILKGESTVTFNPEKYEGEEAEVKSKQELIEEWESAVEAAEFYGKGKEERLIGYMKDFVSDLNQLDEPEVLSQEWIDEHSNGPSRSQYVWVDDLKELLVPKQEKVKIESVWAEDIEDAKASGMTLFKAMNWMAIDSDEKEKQDLFARAWLDGYTVEEQKYVVEFPNITGSDERYLVQGDDGDLWVDGDLDYLQRFDIPKHIFTEEEIKSFDKDYWAFAKPVEEVD